jgi:hypothetical protein
MIIYGDDSTRLGSDRACVRSLNYRVSVHIACGQKKWQVLHSSSSNVQRLFIRLSSLFPRELLSRPKKRRAHTQYRRRLCGFLGPALLSSSLPPPVVVAKPPDTVAYRNPCCPVSCVPVLFLRGLDIVCRMCWDPARPYFFRYRI